MNAKTTDRKYDEVLTGMGYQIEIKYFHNEPYLNASDICKYCDESKVGRPARAIIRDFLSNPKTLEYILEWMNNNLLFTPESKGAASRTFNGLKRSNKNVYDITATAMSKICPALVKVERGKDGKVWFYNELALKLAAYVRPQFDVYITKDYKHLKLAQLNATPVPDDYWSALNEVVDKEHHLLIDAIRSRMVTFGELAELPFSPENMKLAIEDITDRINRVVLAATDDKEEQLLLNGELTRWTIYRVKDNSMNIFIDAAMKDAAKIKLKQIRKQIAEREKESDLTAYQDHYLPGMKARFIEERESGKIYQGSDGCWYDKETNLMVLAPAL